MGRKPKYTSKLTDKQRELITNHYKMVYRVAKYWYDNTRLSFDDCYDSAIDAIVYTVRIFDESKGFRFATLYYQLAKKAVLKKIRDNQADKRILNYLAHSMEEKAHHSDDNDFKNIDSVGQTDEYNVFDKDVLDKVWHVLTEKESYYIKLSFYKDLSQNKISELTGNAQTNVGRAINKGLGKLKKELEKMEMTV